MSTVSNTAEVLIRFVKLGNHYHLLFVCFFYSNWFVPWRLFFQIYRIECTHWPNWHWFHVFCFVFSLSSVEIICDRFPLNFVFALQTLNHLLHTVNWAMNSLKARQFKLINIDKNGKYSKQKPKWWIQLSHVYRWQLATI